MTRWWLPLVVVGLAGCGEDWSVRLPTSPTPVTTWVTTSTWPTRPVDPRFDDAFWRQLVYYSYSYPNDVGTMRSRVLDYKPNFYIRLSNDEGRRLDLDWQLPHIRRLIPQAVAEITGEPFRGRIEEGMADRSDRDWIHVRFKSGPYEPCGTASVGTNPGGVTLGWVPTSPNHFCDSESWFELTFAHELGHAFGFHHVDRRWLSLMNSPTSSATPNFTAREQYHMQLAYEVGRDRPYCGWPYSAACQRP